MSLEAVRRQPRYDIIGVNARDHRSLMGDVESQTNYGTPQSENIISPAESSRIQVTSEV